MATNPSKLFSIEKVTVAIGQTQPLQHAGKFIKLLRTDSPSLIQIKTDKGLLFSLVPGRGLPVDFQYVTVTAPGAVVVVNAWFYVGDVPLMDAATSEPPQTLATTDWITMPNLSFVKVAGILTFLKTDYRRVKAIVTNQSGLPGKSAAAIGILNCRDGHTTISQVAGGAITINAGQFPLAPADAATSQVFPFTLETDDVFFLSASGGALDISIVQIWAPVLI